MASIENLTFQLKKQIDFITRSCILYDQGHYDEAIRIATSIRVLVYDTKSSTSLLALMGLKENVKILSTCWDIPLGVDAAFSIGLITIGTHKSVYQPKLDRGPIKELKSVQEWCNQVVYVLSREQRISRANIFLSAANNDGGAHVDVNSLKQKNNDYLALTYDGSIGEFYFNKDNHSSIKPIDNAHLVAIRQMGHEILNSPDLLNAI